MGNETREKAEASLRTRREFRIKWELKKRHACSGRTRRGHCGNQGLRKKGRRWHSWGLIFLPCIRYSTKKIPFFTKSCWTNLTKKMHVILGSIENDNYFRNLHFSRNSSSLRLSTLSLSFSFYTIFPVTCEESSCVKAFRFRRWFRSFTSSTNCTVQHYRAACIYHMETQYPLRLIAPARNKLHNGFVTLCPAPKKIMESNGLRIFFPCHLDFCENRQVPRTKDERRLAGR